MLAESLDRHAQDHLCLLALRVVLERKRVLVPLALFLLVSTLGAHAGKGSFPHNSKRLGLLHTDRERKKGRKEGRKEGERRPRGRSFLSLVLRILHSILQLASISLSFEEGGPNRNLLTWGREDHPKFGEKMSDPVC